MSWVTILLNILLTLFTLDLVFRGPILYPSEDLRFSRVGFVDSSSAKILFREPDPHRLPVTASYRTESSSIWTKSIQISGLSEATDFTNPVVLTGLSPDTIYHYSLSNNLTGTFNTSPGPSSPSSRSITFLTSSCIKANFPYNLLTHPLSIPGFSHLSSLLSTLPSSPSFMLFLGDFIYVDVPLRLSSSRAHYRSEYRRVYASPSWSLPHISRLPWLHTLDDHEIANDWASGKQTDPYPAAADPFRHYHVSVNPPPPPQAPQPLQGKDGPTTYSLSHHGPVALFILDTRTFRTPPSPSNETTILGAPQLSALLSFLRSPAPPHIAFKIIASSVPFTRNWRFGSADSWAGYPVEKQRVLEAMWAAERDQGVRVVVLSGDRHEFAAVRFPDPAEEGKEGPEEKLRGIHEFSVGPLSMFYLPIRTFWEREGEGEQVLEYVPRGNSKVGVVDVFPVNEGSRLRYRLVVDGRERWEYSIDSLGKKGVT